MSLKGLEDAMSSLNNLHINLNVVFNKFCALLSCVCCLNLCYMRCSYRNWSWGYNAKHNTVLSILLLTTGHGC